MDIELNEELDYEKWDRTKEKTNYSNEIKTKDLITKYGSLEN